MNTTTAIPILKIKPETSGPAPFGALKHERGRANQYRRERDDAVTLAGKLQAENKTLQFLVTSAQARDKVLREKLNAHDPLGGWLRDPLAEALALINK